MSSATLQLEQYRANRPVVQGLAVIPEQTRPQPRRLGPKPPARLTTPKTLYAKIWETHAIQPASTGHVSAADLPQLLYIDAHLIHEVTSPQAFAGLTARGIGLHAPNRIFATMDHSTPTLPKQAGGAFAYTDAQAQAQVETLVANCQRFGVPLFDPTTGYQGIVHVIGPELGITQPGMTVVCGDSHTATHGAFGALAHGIGTSEVEHVMATQTLLQTPSKTMSVSVDGVLKPWVSGKDIILAIIAQIGMDGGMGYVLEYRGSAIRALSMEGRMTLCNMSIEAGARAGLIAPDDVTFAYLADKPLAPKGPDWDAAVALWQDWCSDAGAVFDRSITLDASTLEPMVTYGTNPGMGVGISQRVPNPSAIADASQRTTLEEALAYMQLHPEAPLIGTSIDVAFVGSCTNGRIEDFRAAAHVVKQALAQGKQKPEALRALIVPGSQAVQQQAEAEGLHEVFLAAGMEWREPGCSMCIAMNGDQLSPGQACASTSNRNFKGRQGQGGRTFLMSPAMVAAAAMAGHLVALDDYAPLQ